MRGGGSHSRQGHRAAVAGASPFSCLAFSLSISCSSRMRAARSQAGMVFRAPSKVPPSPQPTHTPAQQLVSGSLSYLWIVVAHMAADAVAAGLVGQRRQDQAWPASRRGYQPAR